ncbi:DUF6588 family protein [Peredibacter sp. HCB2-198]|uniref:DUF6588 family protein n=1 Tax=Peredibacter sp. HCB2-198 TaxID=3383025 RepID=UPI0038B48362
MKKLLALSLLLSMSAYAADPVFDNLSKKDVEDVSMEFGGNFAHTAVAAPETDGLWGIEVGAVGGQTQSKKFADVIDASGGDGSDFKNVYHAAVMARAHFPFDLFVELTVLPEQEFSDVKAKSNSFGLGWNFGRFMNLPLDIAIGADFSKGNVKFHQNAQGSAPESDIELETKTTVYWLGVSKTFAFFTPYAKVGTSRIESDLDATAAIFGYTAATKESVNLSGSFLAVGANIQLFFIKLGVEGAQIQDAKRVSGKLSFDF